MIDPVFLEIAVLSLGLFLLLLEAFSNEKEKDFLAWIGISSLSMILILSFFSIDQYSIPRDPWTGRLLGLLPKPGISSFYVADATAIFFKRFALLTTIIVLVMSLNYRSTLSKFIFGSSPQAGLGEFYSLPVFTCAGLMWMASAVDFIMIFVSLELVTISFYILVSYMRRNNASLEAGVKYLILGALSTGFLVYGITWVFGMTNQTNLLSISQTLQTYVRQDVLASVQTPLLFGIMLILIGLGFKIAAAPFQLWVPDVYQGAPTPITAFLSVGSKAAGFIVLMRVLQTFMVIEPLRTKITLVLVVLAVLTLIYGNLAAMPQNNLKRLLAYSSIGHAGYLLIALACVNATGSAGIAVSFYLLAYLLMTLLAFLVMIVVSNQTNGEEIANFNGLAKRSPFLAFGMLISMLSLAGIPFTAGFVGKLFIFSLAVQQQQYLLVGIGIVAVAAGFYYYLKVVRAMYWQQPVETTAIPVNALTKTVIAGLIAGIFFLGVYPAPVTEMLNPSKSVTSLAKNSTETAPPCCETTATH